MSEEIQELTVSCTLQEPTRHISSASAQVSATLARKRDGTRVALLWSGTGAGGYKNIQFADGIGGALDAAVMKATAVIVSRALGIDYWRCGMGSAPDPQVYEVLTRVPDQLQIECAGRILKKAGYEDLPSFLASRGHPPRNLLDASAWPLLLQSLPQEAGSRGEPVKAAMGAVQPDQIEDQPIPTRLKAFPCARRSAGS